MREVDLGLDLVFGTGGAGSLRGSGGGFRVSAEMFADQNRLVLFQ